MKKIFNILSLGIVLFATTACDSIGEDERYIKADDLEVDRKVLVQEFTGQFCPNCPVGHEALEALEKQFGKNVVIVSIHSGDMAFDDPDYGLKTPDGDTYAKEWNVQFYPSAIVNRKTLMDDRSQWQGAVYSALSTPSTINIELDTEIKDGKINITSKLSATLAAIKAKYQLWIVEDNIVALQEDNRKPAGEQYVLDYVHNHVYRASANGIGGEAVAIPMTEAIELQSSIALDSHWNTENLKVVAFVYNSDGVLQAEEKEVKSEK